ncbi:carbohydrate ABC transporter permease [Oceanobacillus salinisoli]|uniref:carbohydrate ABC transporter permease n=1 Tax=Oceanobacillus salinisoli TaxID=2678611 RepID=UPI0012E102C9|nr:carbohydrate ABC transporter permease [Oceanobacillus salinisoli]
MDRKLSFKSIILHFILFLGIFISLFPFFWMVVMATNETSAVYSVPPKLTFGTELFNNIIEVFESTNFIGSFMNTVFVSVVATVLKLFFASLAGFAFAKFHFPGKNFLFFFLLATMMIPSQLSLVPNFIVMETLGWLGTFKALIIPDMASAFGIFLIKQYAEEAIHNELMDAGRMDGCNTFRLYWNIALPILRPILAFFGMVTFMGVWQDYLWPLIVMTDTSKFTLMIELAQLKSLYATDYALVMTGSVLATIPLIIVFLLFSKQFIAGIADGAVKS